MIFAPTINSSCKATLAFALMLGAEIAICNSHLTTIQATPCPVDLALARRGKSKVGTLLRMITFIWNMSGVAVRVGGRYPTYVGGRTVCLEVDPH
jgi:hypothetical protein